MILAEFMLHWARANSGLISVAGALIIFFSWVVTNTLGQRYSRMKAATESAQATFRLYTTLHEQRGSLNSIAMEVIQRSEAAVSSAKTDPSPKDFARKEYSLTRLSAHQVRELMDFTAETHSLSRAVGKSSPTSTEIEALLTEVGDLYRVLLQHERQAEEAVNAPQFPPEKLTQIVQSYSDHYRSVTLAHVPKLYQRIVAVCNTRQEEASQYLNEAKKQAERAGSISIFLYVVGSCLALTGQAIEKTKPKEALKPPSASNSATANQHHH